ncbi:hypothetical protein B1207_01105 [Legionella quinlivanii]|uniref:Uncharacterized protein n=1 Tax=Legionella quinlivanii TaxID=45073 RepID=A0A364LNA2_9GAMM|nr:hypothetical protein [Legionella quinlivanii]RAP38515.1 hypothetical protein B1207_01105 [Legionella quinlivanii]
MPPCNDPRIDTLFRRFAAIYGHAWWSVYKSEGLLELTKQEWSESLSPYIVISMRVDFKRVNYYRFKNSILAPTIKVINLIISFVFTKSTNINPS